MTDKYSTELCRKIHNDTTGERFEVSEDADALGLVMVRVYAAGGTMSEIEMLMDTQAAKLIASAMSQCACELEARDAKEAK